MASMKHLKLTPCELYNRDRKFLSLGFVQEVLQLKRAIPKVTGFQECKVQFDFCLDDNEEIKSVTAQFEIDPKNFENVANAMKQAITFDARYILDMDTFDDKLVCLPVPKYISLLEDDDDRELLEMFRDNDLKQSFLSYANFI